MPFGDIFGHLALTKSRNGWVPSQKSKKDQLLAYYLWRIHGSKDEAFPFTVTVQHHIRAQEPLKFYSTTSSFYQGQLAALAPTAVTRELPNGALDAA